MRLSSVAPVPLVRRRLHRDLPRPARPADLHLHRRRRPARLPGHGDPRRHLRQGRPRRSAWSPPPTWRRRSARASRPCPRGRWRRPARSASRHARAMVSIVIPQAFRIIIPPLTNELVLLFKDSSLVLFLGVTLEEQRADQVRPRPGQHDRQLHADPGGRPVLPADHRPARLRRPPAGDAKARGAPMTTRADPDDRGPATCTSPSATTRCCAASTSTIGRGEVVCVIGPSGSGKSTLLRCVNLLEEPTRARSSSAASSSPTRTSTSTPCAAGSAWSSSSSTSSRT